MRFRAGSAEAAIRPDGSGAALPLPVSAPRKPDGPSPEGGRHRGLLPALRRRGSGVPHPRSVEEDVAVPAQSLPWRSCSVPRSWASR